MVKTIWTHSCNLRDLKMMRNPSCKHCQLPFKIGDVIVQDLPVNGNRKRHHAKYHNECYEKMLY